MSTMRILNLVCWAVLGIFAAKIKMKNKNEDIALVHIVNNYSSYLRNNNYHSC